MCKYTDRVVVFFMLFVCFGEGANLLGSRAKLLSVKCRSYNVQKLSFDECRVIRNQGKCQILIIAHLSEVLDQIEVTLRIFRKGRTEYVPFLIDITLGWCDFTLNRRRSIFQTLFTIIENSTNFADKCPYNHELAYLNGTMNSSCLFDLPIKSPPGDYRIDVTVICNQVIRVLANAFVQIQF